MRYECGISFLCWQRQYSPRTVATTKTGPTVLTTYLTREYTSIDTPRRREQAESLILTGGPGSRKIILLEMEGSVIHALIPRLSPSR